MYVSVRLHKIFDALFWLQPHGEGHCWEILHNCTAAGMQNASRVMALFVGKYR